MKIKTSDLTGAALDWAVAKCEGLRVEYDYQYTEEKRFDGWWQLGPNHWQPLRKYSSDWAQGGPIIERELIAISPYHYTDEAWNAVLMLPLGRHFCAYGGTPLIAAMRCRVASELGDEIEVPEILHSRIKS